MKQKKKHALPSNKQFKLRIAFICMIYCCTLVGLAGTVGYIKIFKGEEYTKSALGNMTRSETYIEPQRGEIVDRNQKKLATSVLAYDVLLSPYDVMGLSEEKRVKVYETLAKWNNQSISEIKELIESRATSKYYLLGSKVEREKGEELIGVSGVSLNKTYTRTYPKGELAAQVIGYFNKNNEGQYGIEQAYEQYLEGVPGRVFSQFQSGQIVTRELQAAKAGGLISLTLDAMIQEYVSSTMEKYIEMYHPVNASAIIMNPNTGEIYSMYSYPSVNPNSFNDLSEVIGKGNWDKLSNEEKSEVIQRAWENYAIQYNYEPGSTFKPLIVAMCLEEGTIDEDKIYNCTGGIQVADRFIHCWKREGHGHQTLEEGLANSCNVAMIEVGSQMDYDSFMTYVKNYGFGEKTGVDLTGESSGQLHGKLGPTERATYSMGQGLTVTPIQLITAISSIVNGGYLMEPFVVDHIASEEGKVTYEHPPVTKRHVISTDVANRVRNMLKKVVDEGGTGASAAVMGYDIGGKTGTGEKWITVDGEMERDENYVGSFIGFAPINQPEVVGLVVLNGIPDGTGAPAKAFSEMMEKILPYLNINLNTNADSNESNVTLVPNVSGISIYDAVSRLESSELKYEMVGGGSLVSYQYPKAEDTWGKGDTVKLYMTTNQLDALEEIPNLVGMTIEEAKVFIDGMFEIESQSAGKILSQFPKVGSKIEKGNKIIVETTE